ncbi:MAG: DUF3859 domain-containing protein [Candidatus Omnitrophica bacterium]|nr:DUF3859 domain-containing protein [Candidatus Omnitrophota bacterium]
MSPDFIYTRFIDSDLLSNVSPDLPICPDLIHDFIVGMRLHDEYELAPGNWTFQVFLDNKLVVSQTFTVVK